MSIVTNIILTCSGEVYDNGECPAIETLNAWIKENSAGGILTRVDEYAIGPKGVEAEIFIAAINILRGRWISDEDFSSGLELLVEEVKKAPFEDPEDISLFAKDEGGSKFRQLI